MLLTRVTFVVVGTRKAVFLWTLAVAHLHSSAKQEEHRVESQSGKENTFLVCVCVIISRGHTGILHPQSPFKWVLWKHICLVPCRFLQSPTMEKMTSTAPNIWITQWILREEMQCFFYKTVHFYYQICLVQSIWSFKWEKYLHTEMRISDSLCFFFPSFSKYWSAHGAIYSLDTVTFWLLKKPAWEATLSSGIFLPRHFISRLSAVKNTI